MSAKRGQIHSYRSSRHAQKRGGIAYENSAIPDAFRTPRIPDDTHALLGLGFDYEISKSGSLDFRYTHAFVKDVGVSSAVPGAGTLVGNYKVRADVLSLQYNHSF